MKESEFEPGDEVVLTSRRDDVGTVVKGTKELGGDVHYRVRFGAARPKFYRAAQLELYRGDSSTVDGRFLAETYGSRESLDRVLTFTRLKRPLANNLYSYRSTRTLFYEYQYIPLLKFLESPGQRLIIADEVGLGKTIEAGLILHELSARQRLDRVLVVCPSRLRGKWQRELAEKFDEDFEILDTQAMRGFLQRCASDRGPRPLKGIISMQALRRHQLLEELAAHAPPFDLVIVDEAHHMRNRSSNTNRLGRHLGETSDSMLLLTATPVHLGNEDLFRLLQILDGAQFDDFDTLDRRLKDNSHLFEAARHVGTGGAAALERVRDELARLERTPERSRLANDPRWKRIRRQIGELGDVLDTAQRVNLQRDLLSLHLLAPIVTRTLKRDTQEHRPQRVARVWPVQFSKREHEIYDDVTRRLTEKAQRAASYGHTGTWFKLITRQRQMASSMTAMLRSCRHDADVPQAQYVGENSDLDFEFPDEEFEFGDDETEDAAGDIVSAVRASPVDSKLERLLQLIEYVHREHPNEKLIVFAYFRPTITYLEEHLAARGVRCTSIHGGIPSDPLRPDKDERRHRIERFEHEPALTVLLSTEVGGEGLDFQFCGIIVNYDLPWNPMVVEQRIGRIDRHGQKRDKIFIYNLSVEGTVEDRILQRLYNRIDIFRQSIGDLEVILGEQMRELRSKLFDPKLSDRDRETEIERVANVVAGQRQRQRELEDKSSTLFGHDEYIRSELRRIRTGGRFVAGDALRRLIEEHLRSTDGRSGLERTNRDGCHRLTLSNACRQELRSVPGSSGDDAMRFERRIERRRVQITFDSQCAYEDPKLELITATHPLTRWVVSRMSEPDAGPNPVASMRLRSSDLPPGVYAYKGYLLEIKGARDSLRFLSVCLRVDQLRFLDATGGERLLHEAAARGEPWRPSSVDPDLPEIVLSCLDEEMSRRSRELQREIEEENATIIENRLASITRTFQVKIDRLRRQLEHGEKAGHKENIQRMRRVSLRNREAERDERVAEQDGRREVTVGTEDVCAGWIEVVADGGGS